MIRDANVHDVNDMIEFLLPLARTYYPKLTPDVMKMRKSITYATSNGNSFANVSVNDQGLQGVLVALGNEKRVGS